MGTVCFWLLELAVSLASHGYLSVPRQTRKAQIHTLYPWMLVPKKPMGWVEDGCPKPSLQCQRERLHRSPFSQCGPRISCELDRLPKLLLLQPRHLLPYARGSCTLISLPRALSGFVQVRALGGLGFRDLGLRLSGHRAQASSLKVLFLRI